MPQRGQVFQSEEITTSPTAPYMMALESIATTKTIMVARAEISNGIRVCAAKSLARILPSISDGSNDVSM